MSLCLPQVVLVLQHWSIPCWASDHPHLDLWPNQVRNVLAKRWPSLAANPLTQKHIMSFTNRGFHRFLQFWGYQWSVKSVKKSTMVVLKTCEKPWWRCSTAETAAWPDWSSVQRARRRPRLKSLRTCSIAAAPVDKFLGKPPVIFWGFEWFFLNGMCTTDFANRMYRYYIDRTCILYIYIYVYTHTL